MKKASFDFEMILILGTYFSEIKARLEHIEGLYLGLFISDLRYKSEEEGSLKKVEYYKKLSNELKIINKKTKTFNEVINFLSKDLGKLKQINLKRIKQIIDSHKGDYPQSSGINSSMDEIMGKGDSPSVLSRKHTALLLRNELLPVRISMSNFIQSYKIFLSPFDCIKKENIRKITYQEIDKIKSIYSIGCFGEAVFMIGRLLENIITEYLILSKKHKMIDVKYDYIKSSDFTFENKIDFLQSKKMKIITKSQWAKMKSIKWDRNVYGHHNRMKPKDANAIVIIGLQSVEFMDNKISKINMKPIK